MEFLLSINWIALFELTVVALLFVLVHFLSKKLNWTLVILIALFLGAITGIVFSSEDNSYLVWKECRTKNYNAVRAFEKIFFAQVRQQKDHLEKDGLSLSKNPNASS